MKQQKIWLIGISIVGASTLWLACNEKPMNKTTLQGNWILTAAESNGTPATDRLKGIFLHFDKDSVVTNFNAQGSDEHAHYKISSEKILIQSTEPMRFEVIEQKDTLLELATAMRGIEFKLVFHKESAQ
jgi:hypothetical protein